jgi:hypothetical protein
VDPQLEASTQVIVREVMIEDVASLRLAPMPETGTTSRGGLELLDDDLIDPTFVSLSMESCAIQRTRSRYVVSTLSLLVFLNIEY